MKTRTHDRLVLTVEVDVPTQPWDDIKYPGRAAQIGPDDYAVDPPVTFREDFADRIRNYLGQATLNTDVLVLDVRVDGVHDSTPLLPIDEPF